MALGGNREKSFPIGNSRGQTWRPCQQLRPGRTVPELIRGLRALLPVPIPTVSGSPDRGRRAQLRSARATAPARRVPPVRVPVSAGPTGHAHASGLPALTSEFPKRGKLTGKVEIAKATVKFNVIGNPEAHLVLYNGRAKPIDACTVHIYCYDNYDEPVKYYGHGSNRFTGISQRLLKSREYRTAVWTLHGHENTTKVTAKVARWHVKED